jgi:hypothetical protein
MEGMESDRYIRWPADHSRIPKQHKTADSSRSIHDVYSVVAKSQFPVSPHLLLLTRSCFWVLFVGDSNPRIFFLVSARHCQSSQVHTQRRAMAYPGLAIDAICYLAARPLSPRPLLSYYRPLPPSPRSSYEL